MSKTKRKSWKVWAAVGANGKLIHVRMAGHREPVTTLKWLGYQAATLTLSPPSAKVRGK